MQIGPDGAVVDEGSMQFGGSWSTGLCMQIGPVGVAVALAEGPLVMGPVSVDAGLVGPPLDEDGLAEFEFAGRLDSGVVLPAFVLPTSVPDGRLAEGPVADAEPALLAPDGPQAFACRLRLFVPGAAT